MSDEKLSLCPFCGCEVKLKSLLTEHYFHCFGCHTNTSVYGEDKETAINRWNTRAQHSKGMVEKEFLLSKFDGAVRDCTLSDSAKQVVDYVRKIVFDKNSNCEHQWRSWDPIGKNYCAKCGIEMHSKTPKEGSSAEEGETPNDIAWQQGYKAGISAKNTGIPGKTECNCPDDPEPHVHNIPPAKSELVKLDEDKLDEFLALKFNQLLINNCEPGDRYTRSSTIASAICSHFAAPKPSLPSLQSIEDIISLSDLWKYQVTRPGLQRDKRHLAQAIVQYLKDQK